MRSTALLALAGLGLAGCGSDEPARQASVCPRPAILAGLESTTFFIGGATSGREADLVYSAAMENIGGGCIYDDAGLTVDLAIDLLVEPGPAYPGGPVTLPWFVAVADGSGEIIDKALLDSTIEIPPGAVRGGSREAIQQRFAGIQPDAGSGYRLFLGLEIDRDEALRRRTLTR